VEIEGGAPAARHYFARAARPRLLL
jgi:hypothetical protein